MNWTDYKKGHIEKLTRCPDKNFISLIVITVKKEQSKQLVLDSNVINKSIPNYKYQMTNI